MKKLIILDYFLDDNGGHDESYDFSIVREAIHQGIDAQVWCRPRIKANQPFFVKQVLRAYKKKDSSFLERLKEWISRSKEIRILSKDKNLNKDTLIMIQSIDAFYLPLMSLYLIGIRPKCKFCIILRRGLKDDYAYMNWFNATIKSNLNYLAIKLLSRKNFVFYTDSDIIRDELRSKGLISETLPIPHIPKYPFKNPPSYPVIAYIGGARFDKGFDLLPDLIRKELNSNKKIHFIIHAYLQEQTDLMKETLFLLKKLKKKYPKNITLLEKPLSEEEYARCIINSTIILAPYRKQFYGNGTSGVVAEAICAGKWVIVPEGTWMSSQKKKYDKVISFDNLNLEDISVAIASCNDGFRNTAKIKKQISNYRLFHSAKTLLNILKKNFN